MEHRDCIAVCPVECILPAKDIAGNDYSFIDSSRCIACNACSNVCPIEGAILDEWRPEFQLALDVSVRLWIGIAEFERVQEMPGRSDEFGNPAPSPGDDLDTWPMDYESDTGQFSATVQKVIEVDGFEYALLRKAHGTDRDKPFQLYRLGARGDRSVLHSVKGEEFERVLGHLEEPRR